MRKGRTHSPLLLRAWGGGLLIALCASLGVTLGSISHAETHHPISVGISIGIHPVVPYYGWGAIYRPVFVHQRVPPYAEVDVEIKPEKARVYLNGKVIGIADDFDGFPGHLLLRPGRHTLGFALEGRHSLSFELKVRRGEFLELRRTLPKLKKGEVDPGLPVAEADAIPFETDDEPLTEPGPTGLAAPGRLELEVSPPEARVMLDGDFFGTGEEIARLPRGIPLVPGIHRVRVSLEGYRSKALEFRIAPSEVETLRIQLKKQ